MKLRIPDVVQHEVRDAVEYYEAERAGLGDRFWCEVDSQIRWILRNAELPRLRPGDYRRVNLSVFPYYIAYAIRGETIVLLAVAHSARKPEYWTNRPR
jgi:hypothetical protein